MKTPESRPPEAKDTPTVTADESEATLRVLAQTTTAAIFIHRNARVFYVNPAAEALTGYDRAELLEMDFWEIVHPSMRQHARAQGAARLRGETVPIRNEVKIVTKSGQEVWVEFAAATIQYGGEPAVVGTAFDVSDRHRAAAEQRDRERRFRALIENSSDALAVIDGDLIVRYVGPSITRILGYRPDEIEGLNGLDLVHEDDRPRIQDMLGELLSTPAASVTVQYRLRHRDGDYRWMEGALTNMLHEPMVEGIIINARDVTDRRRAEDQARQRQAELAHVLRVTAMGDMAAGLAHELNQPLAAIVNYARGCVRRLAGTDASPEVLAALDHIASEGLRAGEVVRGLKRVVRKEPPGSTLIDVAEVVRDAVALFQADAHDRQIVLRVETAPHLPHFHADRIQIEQVILNLLRNAIDAISKPPGVVSLRVERLDGRAIRVAISDTGDGIPSELRERIFAPFFTTKVSGLGMGLSISRTIVEAHGGRLSADANPSGGTTFSFTLPLDDALETATRA